jgi:hypothetical protein
MKWYPNSLSIRSAKEKYLWFYFEIEPWSMKRFKMEEESLHVAGNRCKQA